LLSDVNLHTCWDMWNMINTESNRPPAIQDTSNKYLCVALYNPFRLLEILFWMSADRVNIKQEGGSDDLTLKAMTKVDISNRPVKFSICVNIYKALRQCWCIYQH